MKETAEQERMINMKERIGLILFAISFLLVMANIAQASGYHHRTIDKTVTINKTTTIEKTNNIYNNEGVASAIAASQHQFNYGVLGWQGSVGIGTFDSKSAFSFGLAKRFNKTLINSSISNEEGKFGAGIGINFTF